MRLKDIGEFAFIDLIRKHRLSGGKGVVRGIGDDCAVFRGSSGVVSLMTIDTLVEDIHFRRHLGPPELLGRKSLAVNLSDIAAMGGRPTQAVVALAVPAEVEVDYLERFYSGLASMAADFDVNVIGGDTTSSPGPMVVSIALLGEAPPEEVLYRSGAKAGDLIFVTGTLGDAAAGLDVLEKGWRSAAARSLIGAHLDPLPQVRAGRIIAACRRASALIDISDGLAADLGHICEQSGVGAVVDAKLVPTSGSFDDYCRHWQVDGLEMALHGGEDYVLLGTVPTDAAAGLERALRQEGCNFFPIGKIEAAPGLRLRGPDGEEGELQPRGWDHFTSGC